MAGNGTHVYPDSEKYSFGDFLLDPVNRTLLREGVELPLTAKAFDLLVALVADPDRLQTKQELIDMVWSEEFVEEGNLARNISTLRKALGDTDKQHKYVVTVQGKGYRFIAPVKHISDEPDAEIKSEKRRFCSSDFTKRPILLSVAAVILAAFVFMLLLGGLASEQPFDVGKLNVSRLTQDGNVYAPVISQDGQYLAYIKLDGIAQGIAVRQVSTGSLIELIKPEVAVRRWGVMLSPDNNFVYYVSSEEGKERDDLYRVPLFGGKPKMIAENIMGYSIAPDGTKMVLARRDVDAGTSYLLLANIDGSDEKQLLSTELETAFFSLDWSPDGQDIVYSVRRGESGSESRYSAEMAAEGGPERRLQGSEGVKIGNIRWLPDRSGLLAIARDEATQTRQLFHLSYPDGKLRQLTNDNEGYNAFSMTADGRTIVTGQSVDNRQIWLLNDGDANKPLAITSDIEKHFDKVEWAGNEFIVSDEDEDGSYRGRNIWRMRPDGSEREQLTSGGDNNAQPTVSPDGRTVVFVSNRSGKSQLWKMKLDGTESAAITSIAHEVSSPQFTKDGKHVYFEAWVNGMNQIWRVEAQGGDATPVIEGVDVRLAAVSPDGSQIAYSYIDPPTRNVETRLRRTDEADTEISLDIRPETWMVWSVDGRSLYFNSPDDGARNVWRSDLNNGRLEAMTNFPNNRVFDCSWSPDGVRMACVRQVITFDALLIRVA